ncbi:MAG: FecR family protein [Tannerellaceae bacterium]|nr:FecR family protein [Tannerellaceae bacterium]
MAQNQVKKKQPVNVSRILSWSLSAAIIIFIITLNFLNSGKKPFNTSDNSVEWLSIINTSVDSVKNIVLPDGSRVWLAESATLTYPVTFPGTGREVFLDGEAYFEIEKDSSISFVVKTDANQIRVVGTSFSVNTHYEGTINEVILTSGTVQLQRLDGIGLINLHPGQKALYSKESNTVEINEVDLSQLTAWKYGLITLSNSSIENILKCLKETYHTSIQMDTSTLQNRRYHFSFKRSRGLQDALEQLTFMTGVEAGLQP